MKLTMRLALAVAVLCVGSATGTAAQQPAVPVIRRGLDRADLDTTCAACTDFYRHAGGGWMEQASIPPAESMWGTYLEVYQRTGSQLHDLLEDARRDTAAPAGSNRQKLGTYYGTCMDSTSIEAEGITAIAPLLERIEAIRTADDVQRAVGELHARGVGALFGFGGGVDRKQSTQIIASAGQGSLGMRTRDYYTNPSAQSQALRDAYVGHVARILELSGESAAQAKRDADRVMALETQLAEASMTIVQLRDPDATYNKMTLAELQALTPHFDWPRYLAAVGAPPFTVINVRQPAFFPAVDGLLGSAPVESWKAYLRWRVLDNVSSALDSAFVDEDFRYDQKLSGLTTQPPRWQRCMRMTSGTLGQALGQEYVKQTFTPEAKARALEMMDNLRVALRERIEGLAWMSDSTKREALAKLDSLRVKIGYPETWTDYSALDVKPGSFVENQLAASRWAHARNLEKIGAQVDRTEWGLLPQTVDASAGNNEIIFPAGILQPPLFDPNADDAVNYGAIGAVIGHELTHHFDDAGRKFDAQGNLRDWWTAADVANYAQRAQLVVEQFDAYTLPDSVTYVNGKFTLGENIADLGGFEIAYDALQKALAQQGRPGLIDGYTPEQRFFLSYAQFWRRLVRPEYERTQVNTDPHAPWNWRVNGPLANMPEFARAFGCKLGDPMVRPEHLRAQIW